MKEWFMAGVELGMGLVGLFLVVAGGIMVIGAVMGLLYAFLLGGLYVYDRIRFRTKD